MAHRVNVAKQNARKANVKKPILVKHDGVNLCLPLIADGKSICYLTEQFAEVPECPLRPDGRPIFVRDSLKQHQRIAVKAVLDYEEIKTIVSIDQKISSNAIVLVEPLGSGKSFEILATIGISPLPRATPSIHHAGSYTGATMLMQNNSHDALITSTLIVVSSSVLAQWEQLIKTGTTLSCARIGSMHDLRKLQEIMTMRTYPDIVLVKCGLVSGSFVIPGEIQGKDQRHMIEAIQSLTGPRVWARVVIDDFDTLGLAGTYMTNALSTIYVSASYEFDRYNATRFPKNTSVYTNIIDAVQSSKTLFARIWDVNFTAFTIASSKDLIDKSTSMPIVEIYKCVYINPDDKIIGLVGDIGADAVVEMLNGDAINAAAERLGMVVACTADIFKRILDTKYQQYEKSIKTLAHLNDFEDILLEAPVHKKDLAHSVAEIESARGAIGRGDMPKIEFYSQPMMQLIDELRATHEGIKQANGAAIERVMNNVRDGECGQCFGPLRESAVVIMRCCGMIVDSRCAASANHVRARGTELVGRCGKCARDINPTIDFIFVDRGVSITDLLTKDIAAPPPIIVEAAAVPKYQNPKLAATIAICHGLMPEGAQRAEIGIENIMDGINDIPRPEHVVPKVIIFASQNETLDLVAGACDGEGIKHMRLGGTYMEMARAIEAFRDSDCTLLLIDSTLHCAGVNLQFATDLILYHDIHDKKTRNQVIGRIQRIGRVCNARVWFLLYKNEAKGL